MKIEVGHRGAEWAGKDAGPTNTSLNSKLYEL
jgi:hypothetical protein